MDINLLGLGVQKAGTSTLHDILKQHPQIFLPEQKEAHFFDRIENYQKGKEWLLQNYFSEADSQKIIGEFTPEYIYFDEVPRRIVQTLGTELKFIIVLRHPVDRAVSHYNMTYRRGIEKEEFHRAIANEQEEISKSEFNKARFSYLSRGLYYQQIKRYFDIFPKENFLILVFEKDIIKELQQTILKIQSFLGVDIIPLQTNVKSNEAYAPRSVILNRLIRSTGKIKQLVSFLLPKKARTKLKKSIVDSNRINDKRKVFKITPDEKKKLFDKYFLDDVKQLESLLGVSLKGIWY